MKRDDQLREITILRDPEARSSTVFGAVNDHFQLWRVCPVDGRNSVVHQSLFLPKPPPTAGARR